VLESSSSADMIAGSSARSDVASLQYPLLLKARAGDEPLWAQVAQLFAVSDDEPVARLLSLQALSTFPPPLLFKTLTLLLSSSQEQEHEHEHEHEHERQEVTSDKDKTAEAQAQEAQAQEDKGAAQELEAEEEEPLEPSLKRDEVLTLVRAVRSLSGKRAAWAWLSEQLTKPNAEPLLGFEQLNVQRALIQWGRASCDEAGVELMERAARAELGFSPELAPEAQLALKLMRRCLKLQAAHPRVTTWAKRALKMK
jgi:hypothetical protein